MLHAGAMDVITTRIVIIIPVAGIPINVGKMTILISTAAPILPVMSITLDIITNGVILLLSIECAMAIAQHVMEGDAVAAKAATPPTTSGLGNQIIVVIIGAPVEELDMDIFRENTQILILHVHTATVGAAGAQVDQP